MRRLLPSLGVLLALAAALPIACNKSPAAPAGGGLPTPVRFEITGPASVPPGTATQFRAVLAMSDSSARDVTNEAQWRSNNIDMSVGAPGLVTGVRTSAALLTAVYGGMTSTREVIFVPDGTFRLKGVVTDPRPPSGPVHFATIDVVAGTGRGLRSFTTEEGQFQFFGVAGDIELRITKEGYQTRSEQVTVNEHTSRTIDLFPIVDAPDVSGSYTLTIAAADICSGALPTDAMVRTYSATVRQVGPALTVTVGGATFGRINGWSASVIREGRVQQNSVQLSFGTLGCDGYYYGCGPSILEQIGPTRFFLPTGTAVLPISPNALRGEINGTIEVHEGNSIPGVVRTASCKSTRHQITFTR